MKKVLIISYFYPPANFVGARRTKAWANYLFEFGYYPIIITRQWNQGQTDLVDKIINNELAVEKRESHEVHRLPYNYTLRDRLSNYPILKPLQKALTLKELVFSNFSIMKLPFANFYTYSKDLLKNDPGIHFVIASGRPFQSFFIGHQLKKDFPSIHWVPDYRDEWSTHQTPKSLSHTHKLMKLVDKNKERKWTSNASFFISVTQNWTKNIANFVNISGETVLNGFESESTPYSTSNRRKKDIIELSYIGSAYSTQDFSVFIDSLFSITESSEAKVILNFFGSKPAEFKNISNSKSFANGKLEINFFDRTNRQVLIQKVKETDMFFLTSLKDNSGWLPVKLFDYFNSDKPILLCPSDKGLMEDFIKETNSGYIANTKDECVAILEKLIQLKKEGKPLIGPRNNENASFYSRKHQTNILAELLDSLQ